MNAGIEIKKYLKYYNENAFRKKLLKLSGKLSSQLLTYLLVLYDLLKDKKIPTKTRLIFIAALGYFILPTDLVADFLPVLGFTDDLAFLTYAVTTASAYITPEVIEKAKAKKDQILKKDIDTPLSETA
jgi:uncharacterized membrane protein YkvA (DUF1232 family)